MRYQLTNTWVGTVRLERSLDGGSSYALVRSFTSTASTDLSATTTDARYRFRATAYTSGTVSYSLANVTYVTDRTLFPNIEVGSVAYGSLGSVLSPPVTGTLYVTDVVIRKDMTATGIGILNGATCGTNAYVLWLFDSSGLAVANTSLSGTTCSGTDAFQQIAFTSTKALTAGRYFIGARVNGTTDRTRFVAGSTFLGLICSATAHSSTVVGSFGSSIFAIPAPTAFTAGQCPIAYVYGS